MIIKLFVIGRPGSGKSTAFYCMKEYVEQEYEAWTAQRINDYAILYKMSLDDTKHKFFHPTSPSGFEVRKKSKLDHALKKLQKQAKKQIHTLVEDELIVMEFARNDYHKAFKLFGLKFLRDAYFLFIETDVETCIERIRERVAHPTKYLNELDRHFVEENILRGYYNKDSRKYMVSEFGRDYKIAPQRIKVIDNAGSLEDFLEEVKRFAETIMDMERNKSIVPSP